MESVLPANRLPIKKRTYHARPDDQHALKQATSIESLAHELPKVLQALHIYIAFDEKLFYKLMTVMIQ